MTLYETLKFIHIVAAIAVVGGGLFLTILMATAVVRKRAETILTLNSIGQWVGLRFFAPAWVLLLAFGVWATLEGNLSFGDAWITIGFVVFAIAFLMGPTVHERHARQLKAAIETEGPTSAPALDAARRDMLTSIGELALLIFAVWAMTAKPGL